MRSLPKFHYDDVMQTSPHYRRLIEEFAATNRPPDELQEMLSTRVPQVTALILSLMVHHKLQGQQTYVVGPRIAAMLEHTGMAIGGDDLLFPHSTFYVALPDFPHQIWVSSTIPHTVQGVYLEHTEKCLVLGVWATESGGSPGMDDAHVWTRLYLEGEGDLETIFRLALETDISGRHSPAIGANRIQENETLTAVYRIAVNLCLYLAAENAEVEPVVDERAEKLRKKYRGAKTRMRKKIKRQLARLSQATVFLVGASIEARVAAQVKKYGSVKAHWVRGFYRHYAVGEGRRIRVRKWIEPHPRGLRDPDDLR